MDNKHMNSRDVIKRLKRDGWQHVRTKGDHHIFSKADMPYPVVVPHPVRELPVGTLRSIFRQAGWNWQTRRQ